MKGKIIHLLTRTALLFFCGLYLSCNGENVPDCFQNTGQIFQEEVSLPAFDKIIVFEHIELILEQGTSQRVVVETGEFLRNDLVLEVNNGTLELRNNNACNLLRPYGTTKIYITSPNIRELRSSTGFPIRSDGVLSFDNLTLYSESFLNPEAVTTDGSFLLDLDCQTVNIVVNGIAYFVLKGQTENLNINIASGDSRIEAAELTATRVSLNHRGSNDIQIFPVNSLSGVIRGTGDVESFNRPDSVTVEQLYKGRLIFID